MSTISVDNAKPSAGGTAYSLTDGVAKAWVNLNGTGTIATRDSYNVSSLTDNGTGQFTVSVSSSFANANYSVVGGSLADNPANHGGVFVGPQDASDISTSSAEIRSHRGATSSLNSALIDRDLMNALFIGDLA